jgi:hypothetical protein
LVGLELFLANGDCAIHIVFMHTVSLLENKHEFIFEFFMENKVGFINKVFKVNNFNKIKYIALIIITNKDSIK